MYPARVILDGGFAISGESVPTCCALTGIWRGACPAPSVSPSSSRCAKNSQPAHETLQKPSATLSHPKSSQATTPMKVSDVHYGR